MIDIICEGQWLFIIVGVKQANGLSENLTLSFDFSCSGVYCG